MNYALQILQSSLNDELKAKADADDYIEGIRGVESYYQKDTIEAFKESRRLAIERIPQLRDAIARINASDHP